MEPRALERGVAMGRDQEIRQEDKLMTFENVEWVPGIGDREGEVNFVGSLMGIMKIQKAWESMGVLRDRVEGKKTKDVKAEPRGVGVRMARGRVAWRH